MLVELVYLKKKNGVEINVSWAKNRRNGDYKEKLILIAIANIWEGIKNPIKRLQWSWKMTITTQVTDQGCQFVHAHGTLILQDIGMSACYIRNKK